VTGGKVRVITEKKVLFYERRISVKKYSILLAIFILAIVLIAGCGGGGGTTGVVPNNVTTNPADPTPTPGTLVQVPGNPTNPSNPTLPSNLPTGSFKVEVKFPGAGAGADMKELLGSDFPYNSHTLKVTITGEAIATAITGQRNDLDPTGAGTYTLTVPNVPVGLNTATIEVLDPGGNLLCQRKHGFYMTPGATEGPGLILLGVAIQGDGSYVPVNIDIPAGSSISFQNHDYTNDRTASMSGGTVTVGPIGHATHITQPVTAEVFPATNHLFNTSGQFDYDGQSGRVLVYGLPTLTSVTPDKDSTNGTTAVSFTLAGTNFGTSQASVNGEVRFIQVHENDPNNPWGTVVNPSSFTSWGNTSIAGTINLPEGKYRIEVSVRGENTTETVFFYKGTGTYQVIVGELVQMVFIEGGTFLMGQADMFDALTHNVTVNDFNIGKYEVTNKEYVEFLNEMGNQSEGGARWIRIDAINSYVDDYIGITSTGNLTTGPFISRPDYESRPVAYITWYGAAAYCNWLSQKHGITPCYGPAENRGTPDQWRLKNGYRLPTEAEWEYSCRGGSNTAYHWGNSMDDSYCWYNGNSEGQIKPAGQKQPNAWGLYDMSGNLDEWCSDWYDDYSNGGPIWNNPTGPATGYYRVQRGGSWLDDTYYTQSAARYSFLPSYSGSDLGFRIVRTK
jgi:formylglycine-generating enzyme required for sulfatase activity